MTPTTTKLPEPTRTTWILAPAVVGEVVLGPGLRILAQAEALVRMGHRVHLGLLDCRAQLPPGIEFHPLSTSLLESIRPGDGVIVQSSLRIRWLWALVRRRIPFDVDFYNILSIETLETFPRSFQPRSIPSLRRKMSTRESILARLARRVYVSHPMQMAFLAGLMADDPGSAASRLPDRCIEIPMGIPDTPMLEGAAFPYPDALRGRPVFLWGGGLWSWMDPRPLLEAFAKLQASGSDAALFFIAGANHSPSRSEDGSVQLARQLAEELGVLGRSVFFNERKAGPGDLPAYLEHCCAGILCNSATLESAMSWRTRQLDLLWAGRPALVAGRDPLSDRLAERGCAVVCAPDPSEIAKSASLLAEDAGRRRGMGEAARALGERARWSQVLEPFCATHADPQAFRTPGPPVPWRLVARYLLG